MPACSLNEILSGWELLDLSRMQSLTALALFINDDDGD